MKQFSGMNPALTSEPIPLWEYAKTTLAKVFAKENFTYPCQEIKLVAAGPRDSDSTAGI